MMREHGLDALVIQGANNLTGIGGYYAWFTGVSAAGSYPQTAIFPREGDMTLVRHGGFGVRAEFDPQDPETYGIANYIGTPTFPSISYTLAYDAQLIHDSLAKQGLARIGLVSPGTMYAGFLEAFRANARNLSIADFTSVVDDIKAIKSEDEIEMIRKAAVMQDTIMSEIGAFIVPGMRDFEVMAEAHRIGQRLGSETGFFLGSSFRFGDSSQPVRHRPEQGRTIREGDIFLMLAENAGPGGMYVHISRFYSLGKADAKLTDAVGQAVEAQEFTLSLLTPGIGSNEVFSEYNAYMRQRKFAEELRLHAHGQGYDVVERPLIRNDEAMLIRPGMNLGVHPAIATPDVLATICDNFIIHANSAERVHTTERRVFEL